MKKTACRQAMPFSINWFSFAFAIKTTFMQNKTSEVSKTSEV
jgi:hypothetical protein